MEHAAEPFAQAAEPLAHAADLGALLPIWSILPFVGILLSIALFPLLAPHFWHMHFPKVSAFWALLFAVPFLLAYRESAAQELLHIGLIDYAPFIILLWCLFTVAGGIYVSGEPRGTPGVNVALLAVGTFLASWIGTTGAAMVMIRPVLRANAWRKHQAHVIVFFIFLVANVGGSLTPLGDPPLFLGFLHGVPFFWVTTGLLRHMLTVAVMLLAIFWLLDRRMMRAEAHDLGEPRDLGMPTVAPREKPAADAPREKLLSDAPRAKLRLEGAHNLLLLLAVMGCVLFSGSVKLSSIPLWGHVHLAIQNVVRDVALILIGLVSLRTTARATHEKNGFSWAPIQEVAVLFAGIFVTIVPALKILQAGEDGALAPLTRAVSEPVHYFWVAGALSSFLDNAPTYLTFFNAALGSLGAPESAVPAMLGYSGDELLHPGFVAILQGISAGAVFMGANTYIGNAPNFMVKSIAEEAGIVMPSFFGYLLRYSIPILIPCFLVVSLLYF